MLDVGRVGPDYIPGHAHADSLGFELSLFGQRLICDSGTSEYGSGEERVRQRGTAAHNTVLVNQQNSSEVWSGFRVARRAYPIDVNVTQNPTHLEVTAAHTGYRRLKGKNIHRRLWSVSASRITISDTVTGVFETATATFHIHPAVSVELDGELVRLTLPSGHRAQFKKALGAPTSRSEHLASTIW